MVRRASTATRSYRSVILLTLLLGACGGGGGGGSEPAADPPVRPTELIARNDLEVVPNPGAGGRAGVLLRFVQLTDIHMTDESFRIFSKDLESLVDDFGDAIGFGGFQRAPEQEERDVDVLAAFVATINAMSPEAAFVVCTGDSADSGITSEASAARDGLDELRVPWFQTVGNHDDLALGVIPPDIASGVVSGDYMEMDDFVSLFFGDGHDPSERIAAGHGFGLNPRYDGSNPRSSRAYYAFDAAPPRDGNPAIRLVVLETTEEGGGANGSIGDEQLGWLRDELDASRAKLVVLVSHHRLADLDSPFGVHDGGDVRRLLAQHPEVIAHVSGHTHIHSVTAHLGSAAGTGYWEIQGSSLIDQPQHGRVFEIASNGDGTGTLTTYVFEQRAHGALGESARISADAAARDPFDGSGDPEDRDVELAFPLPAG